MKDPDTPLLSSQHLLRYNSSQPTPSEYRTVLLIFTFGQITIKQNLQMTRGSSYSSLAKVSPNRMLSL